MNLIYDKLPDAVVINDVAYPVYSDFRQWIAFFDMMADEEYEPKEKVLVSLSWFQDKIPSDIMAAWEGLLQFSACESVPGEAEKKELHQQEQRQRSPIFSWVYDSAYILGAFRQIYHMDLRNVPFLHWYEFKALFDALPEEIPLKKRIGYRALNPAEIKDKKRRQQILKIRNEIRIPSAVMSAGQVGSMFG